VMEGSVSILHILFASRCILGGARVPSFSSAHHNVPLRSWRFLGGTIIMSDGKISMRYLWEGR
jgi:hypothetical protein